MTKYLITIHRPDDYDPAVSEDAAMGREIDALNNEMVAAGVRIFVGGMSPVDEAKSVTVLDDGGVNISDGNYLKTGEHVGGLWVLELADMDEALEWGQKAAVACRAAVEVRAFL